MRGPYVDGPALGPAVHRSGQAGRGPNAKARLVPVHADHFCAVEAGQACGLRADAGSATGHDDVLVLQLHLVSPFLSMDEPVGQNG